MIKLNAYYLRRRFRGDPAAEGGNDAGIMTHRQCRSGRNRQAENMQDHTLMN